MGSSATPPSSRRQAGAITCKPTAASLPGNCQPRDARIELVPPSERCFVHNHHLNVQHEGFTAWTVRIGNIRLIITIIIERASPKWNVLSCLSPKLARILLPSNSLDLAPGKGKTKNPQRKRKPGFSFLPPAIAMAQGKPDYLQDPNHYTVSPSDGLAFPPDQPVNAPLTGGRPRKELEKFHRLQPPMWGSSGNGYRKLVPLLHSAPA